MKLPPPARWEVCTPEFAKNFTAVGYFFAREIHKTKKIPIGIIHSSAGATAAEAWTSATPCAARCRTTFPQQLADIDKAAGRAGPDFDYFRELEKWTAAVDPTSARLKYTSDPDLDTNDWLDIAVPKPWQEAGPAQISTAWSGSATRSTCRKRGPGKDLPLVLSIINDTDIVWFNGTADRLAANSRHRAPIASTASLVKPGKNLLSVGHRQQGGARRILLRPQQHGASPGA